jgi:hypothetical protein
MPDLPSAFLVLPPYYNAKKKKKKKRQVFPVRPGIK